MTSISSIALSGMNAAQAQLDSSAHNIANLATPGFHRQEVVQTAQSGGGVAATLTQSSAEGSSLEADVVSLLQARNAFIANLDIRTIYGGNDAYYLPGKDEVHLPDLAQFDDTAGFYGVSIHEYGHASGAKHRLDRDLTGRFGSEKYAAEECVAEMTAGFVLADLGIAHHPRADHAAYIATWLKAIKSDPRAIFAAASKAQQAADWMHAQQDVVAAAA